MTILSVAAGLVLIGIVVRDVAHELFHPAGAGTVSRRVRRGTWRLLRARARGRPARLRLAGPLVLAAVLGTWVVLALFGWALLYLPFLPDGFRYAAPLVPAAEAGPGTALYVSAVTLGTLGFGDITPIPFGLRMAAALQAFVGFMLLTAAISWTLSLKPVLAERRALASSVHALLDAERRTGQRLEELPAADLRPVLLGLAGGIALARARLLQSPESYYFHPGLDDASLAAVLPTLLDRCVATAAGHEDAAIRFHAAALERGLAGLATVLAGQFLAVPPRPPEQVFRRYAEDHLRA